jgi:hypothetical protein
LAARGLAASCTTAKWFAAKAADAAGGLAVIRGRFESIKDDVDQLLRRFGALDQQRFGGQVRTNLLG